MTAVEWLENKCSEFETLHYSLPSRLYEYIQQAKEMEKQQIIDAYNKAVPFKYGKEYYNETYNLSQQDKP